VILICRTHATRSSSWALAVLYVRERHGVDLEALDEALVTVHGRE
jgi:hypothetical protein